MQSSVEGITEAFNTVFKDVPSISQAPGRVNIIGEHTDYNEGFVLPSSINLRCWVACAARQDRHLMIYSENNRETTELALDNTKPSYTWSDYALGVAVELEKAGYRLPGVNLYVRGDVPLGSGLSSSAAIEVATAYALLNVAGWTSTPTEIARLCQRAENVFVGANCGIMDQFVSCHGAEGKALLLDCRSLEFRLIPIPRNIRLVTCNSMVKHELNQGEYNLRRTECEDAVRILATVLPGIRSLRDVTLENLREHGHLLSNTIYRRCKHVVTENARVQQMVMALESADTAAMFDLMAASHNSLRNDFEVSCPELDKLVDLAVQQRGVFGARMMGGGFGGCTINLVDAEAVPVFRNNISNQYCSATGMRPDIDVCIPSEGAGLATV